MTSSPLRASWRCLVLPLLGTLTMAAAPAPMSAAIFPFQLDDTSPGAPPGRHAQDEQRLAALRPQLAELLAKSGKYRSVDIAPVAAEVKHSDLLACGGCAEDYAKKLGAQVAVVGWVQKVSELILNINARIVDVKTGRALAGGSVDIRGDTDESWHRGLAYLVDEHLLTEPGAQ